MDEVTKTAYHEAGHALVSSLMPRLPSVKSVTAHGIRRGHTDCASTAEEFEALAERGLDTTLVVQALAACFAGHLAERIALGRKPGEPGSWPDESGTDWQRAASVLWLFIQQESERRRWTISQLKCATRAMLAAGWLRAALELETGWGAVKGIAAGLEQVGGYATGELVRTWIDCAPPETRNSLDSIKTMKALIPYDRDLAEGLNRVLDRERAEKGRAEAERRREERANIEALSRAADRLLAAQTVDALEGRPVRRSLPPWPPEPDRSAEIEAERKAEQQRQWRLEVERRKRLRRAA